QQRAIIMKPYIFRERYLNKIKPFVNKELIKVFVGQRRVGKSYLMYQIIDFLQKEDNKRHSIYINKELNEFDDIKNYQQLYDYVKSKSLSDKINYLFIDEIQNIENFENALKSFTAEGNFDIYCTGSNADLLSGELATYLSGRYVEFNIFPLSYNEFLTFHNLTDQIKSLDLFLKYGGLPYLKNLQLEDDIVFDYLKNVYQAILFRDIVLRFKLRNVEFLERLILFLAKHTGTIFSARNIVKFLKSQNIKISVSSVLDYVNYLKTAFFISKANRTDIQGKKVFEVGEKYYFTDIGLRNTIAGFSPFELNLIIENAVYNHLQYLGYKILVGQSGDKEIDFIAEKNNEKVYIQVALRISSEEMTKREFGNLLEINDNYPKYVITLDEYTGTTYKGVKHTPLREFLIEFE
ncbi:MAG: ATP-binding protein, partial [Bacteroidota bacterium]|nr:ATP-binding protein [Bacteroidota bacterium]